MFKKFVSFGVLLCALCLFSPQGECAPVPPSHYNHNNLAPTTFYNYGQLKTPTAKNPLLTNHKPAFYPNSYNTKVAKKNHKSLFFNKKNKPMSKIGKNKVFYKNNRPYSIGNQRVIYGPNHRIKSIGNKPVIYRNGKIHQIGDLPVIYNNDNEIIRIGNFSVSYNA